MLRITITLADKLALKLEGRLVGEWVDELRRAVLQSDGWRHALLIDVSDLTFADESGEHTLCWLHRMGARFQAKGAYSEYLLGRLKIPFASRQAEFDRTVGHGPG